MTCLLFFFVVPSVRGRLWKRPAPGPRPLRRWWRARRGAAASGSSCGRSSARRTWCSGWPARSWRRKPIRPWSRRRFVKYTRISSPSFPRKRWAAHQSTADTPSSHTNCCVWIQFIFSFRWLWSKIHDKLWRTCRLILSYFHIYEHIFKVPTF